MARMAEKAFLTPRKIPYPTRFSAGADPCRTALRYAPAAERHRGGCDQGGGLPTVAGAKAGIADCRQAENVARNGHQRSFETSGFSPVLHERP